MICEVIEIYRNTTAKRLRSDLNDTIAKRFRNDCTVAAMRFEAIADQFVRGFETRKQAIAK
jgi:hypothetical protein